MFKERVRPSGAGREVLWLLVSVVVVLAVSGTVIHSRTRKEKVQVLADSQMSAFSQLNDKKQGTFNDLFAAQDFLVDEHDFQGHVAWPQVSRLEEEVLPPFVHDRAWLSRGKLQWSMKTLEMVEPGERVEQFCAFMGVPGEEGVSGVFLLVLRHHHDEGNGIPVADHEGDEDSCRVWYHPAGVVAFPEKFSRDRLIVRGWREVVPFNGKEERIRLKGGTN